MTREDKIKKRKIRSVRRAQRNLDRNKYRWERHGRGGLELDCPFDVDMNGMYGTCTCNHENYNSCLGDI